MEQIMQSYLPGHFMGSALVARGSEVLLSKGYGSADLEWDIPNAPNTKFRLGIDDQAVHGGLDSDARRTRQAEREDPVKNTCRMLRLLGTRSPFSMS